MSELKERKGRPSFGTYMERLIQKGRWKESSCQDRNSKTFLNFLVLLDSALDILGCSSGVDSLVSSEVTGAQEVRL
jgi:hypothetical protein